MDIQGDTSSSLGMDTTVILHSRGMVTTGGCAGGYSTRHSVPMQLHRARRMVSNIIEDPGGYLFHYST